MVNGYRIDEAAASAGARVLAGLTEAVARRRELAAAANRRLHAAGLAVLDVGDGAQPNWQWLIALAPSRKRRDEVVSACRTAGVEVVMPVAAFAQPAQLHRRALPNTRAFCDLALKFAVVPGLDARLAAAL